MYLVHTKHLADAFCDSLAVPGQHNCLDSSCFESPNRCRGVLLDLVRDGNIPLILTVYRDMHDRPDSLRGRAGDIFPSHQLLIANQDLMPFDLRRDAMSGNFLNTADQRFVNHSLALCLPRALTPVFALSLAFVPALRICFRCR